MNKLIFYLYVRDPWEESNQFFTILLTLLSGFRYPHLMDLIQHLNYSWQCYGDDAVKEIKPEILTWLNENAKYFIVVPRLTSIFFYRKQDATLFKLTWG